MGLIGTILGDIAGSKWEFGRPNNLDWKNVELFNPTENYFTDDTVLAIATKYAIDNNLPFTEIYQKFANDYPNCSYGGTFDSWRLSKNPMPYNSFGNGSAMRVAYVADKFSCQSDIIKHATESAECTHNHTEGIKGAVVTAMCSYMARTGATKTEMYEYVRKQYNHKDYQYSVEYPLDYVRREYKWDVTCQGSVPVAIRCFLESDDYESFIRNVLSLPCDTDTLCAIGGCIAENYYKTTGFDNDKLLRQYLDTKLYNVVVS